MQGHLGIHLGLSWAILGFRPDYGHVLTLSTLSALPVPMLRQVYLPRSYGLQNGDFAWDILDKWEDGDVNSMLL